MKTKFPAIKTIVLNIENFKYGLDAFNNENTMDYHYSVDCYNFDFKTGALKEGIGFSELTFPSNEEEGCQESVAQEVVSNSTRNYYKIAHYVDYSTLEDKRTDKLVLLTEANEVLYGRIISTYPSITRLNDITFESKPKTCNLTIGGTKYIFFFGTDQPLRAWDNNSYGITYNNAPNITDFCMHDGVGFGIVGKERDNIRIDKTALNSWNGTTAENGVNVLLDSDKGYANRLLSFKNYVFVLRDYGITRVAYDSENKTYALNNLLYSGSRIYGDTACICGNKGIVLCKDGIYQFDNVYAKKIDLKLNNFLSGVSNKNAVATFKDGIYYLACKLNFGDGVKVGCEFSNSHKNNALVVLDTNTYEYSVYRGVDINDLCTLQYKSADKVLASFNVNYKTVIGQLDGSGLWFGLARKSFWKSPLSDIGYPDQEKLIKEVSIFTKYEIKLTVFSEKESKDFIIKGSNSASKIPVKIRGNKIGISITSNTEKAEISNLKMSIDLLGDVYV